LARELDIRRISGLTEAEAANRLKTEGYNELPSAKRRSILSIAFDVVREPMFLLLVACGVIYMILGDHEEALMLLGFVFVVMGITLYQERKTERALEALRSPNAALWWVLGGATVFLSLVLYVPFLRDLFRFAFLHPIDIAICLVAGVISIGWFEGLKLLNRRKQPPLREGS
jgi:hypothetical protein